MIWIQLIVVLLALFVGARYGGVVLGMMGGVGLAILAFVFKLTPTSPPIDVLFIILTVVVAASTLEGAGGMDYLVSLAESLLRKNPARITFIAPFVAYLFTILSGTGNVAYSILPVIAEVARESGVRPERPMSISVIASQFAIVACPISAATVALVGILAPLNITLINILSVTVPSTLIGIGVACFFANRMGKELNEDPEYLERVRLGIAPPISYKENVKDKKSATKEAKLSVVLFLLGTVLVVLFGSFPSLRPLLTYGDKVQPLSMSHTIEIVMLAISALIVVLCKVKSDNVVSGSVFNAGMMGIVAIFGLAWMSDTFVAANLEFIKESIQGVVTSMPWVFSIALFMVSCLTQSQAATTRALMPLGLSLGIPGATLVGVFAAVNGFFFIPNYATLISGVAFDRTGTTKIGKYVLNHSYMIPGMVAIVVTIVVGLFLGNIII